MPGVANASEPLAARLQTVPTYVHLLAVDDRVRLQAIERAEQGVPIQDVGNHRFSAERSQPVEVGEVSAQADHLVTGRDQLAGKGDAHGSGRTGDEDPHGLILRARERVCSRVFVILPSLLLLRHRSVSGPRGKTLTCASRFGETADDL